MNTDTEQPVAARSARILVSGRGRIAVPPEVLMDTDLEIQVPDPISLSMPRAGSGPNPVNDMLRLSQAVHINRKTKRRENHGRNHRTA